MRILSKSAGFLSLVLTLAVGTIDAAQGTMPSSPQQSPSMSAPAQNPQTAPAQNPSAAPSQSPTMSQPAAGQAGAGASTPSQAQKQDENPLNLTDEQKAKLRPILLEENQQMDAVRNDSTLTQDQKIAKANEIRHTAGPKIRAVLTPEQLQKLADLQQKAKQQQNQGAPAEPPK